MAKQWSCAQCLAVGFTKPAPSTQGQYLVPNPTSCRDWGQYSSGLWKHHVSCQEPPILSMLSSQWPLDVWVLLGTPGCLARLWVLQLR